MTEPLKIGVLLSGSGTNLQAIIDAAAEGLPVEIVHVVSSRPDAFGIERAHRAGIPVTVLNRDVYADPVEADRRIAETLRYAHAEYVVMAGYMRKVTPVLLDAFPDRVLNLHPALLPSFKGAHAIQDAFDAGVKVTGITVHFANEDYDKEMCIRDRVRPEVDHRVVGHGIVRPKSSGSPGAIRDVLHRFIVVNRAGRGQAERELKAGFYFSSPALGTTVWFARSGGDGSALAGWRSGSSRSLWYHELLEGKEAPCWKPSISHANRSRRTPTRRVGTS